MEFIKLKEKNYLGSKAGNGTIQYLINQFPKHKTFFVGFLGHGATLRFKKPARFNIGCDIDPSINQLWKSAEYTTNDITSQNLAILQQDFLKIDLPCFYDPTTLVYLDPTYPFATRTSNARYNYELRDEDHIFLLDKISAMTAMVAISTYDNDIYKEKLKDWRKFQFQSMTRGGMRTETLYMNYPQPNENTLHDCRFVGIKAHAREKTKRRLSTIYKKIKRLEPLEFGRLREELRKEVPELFLEASQKPAT